MMKRMSIDLEFTTPCFLGGADNECSAEWRAASIRGQVRWWFRAVAGGTFGGDLKKVQAAEERIWGSTSNKSKLRITVANAIPKVVDAGQANPYPASYSPEYLATVWGIKNSDPAHSETVSRLHLKKGTTNPLYYLAFGCINWIKNHGHESVRPRIEAGEPASFSLQINRPLDAADQKLLGQALWAWLNLGGIGSKSRRGFGSLRIFGVRDTLFENIPLIAPDTPDEFRDAARTVLRPAVENRPSGGALPEWSHFSPGARVLVGTHGEDTWQRELCKAGAWLIAFRRRYGNPGDGRTLGTTPVRNRDYAWAAQNGVSQRNGIPDRAGFGLPLPFPNANVITWGEGKDKRRASPLLLRVSQIGKKFYSVWTHLPAQLVPPGETLRFKGDTVASRHHPPSSEQNSIVRFFLDDLESSAKRLLCRVLP